MNLQRRIKLIQFKIYRRFKHCYRKLFPYSRAVHADNLSALQDDEFIRDSKAALLNKTTPVAHFILYTIITMLVACLIWAHFAVIDEITIGMGKVIPSSQVKTIQSLDGGIIAQIPAKEGDMVQQGDILVQLDDTRYKADYQQGYARYLALTAMTKRLLAEAQGKEQIDFPEELLRTKPDLVASETNLFKTDLQSLQDDTATLQRSYDYAKGELNIIEPMVAKGIVAKIELLRTERTANELKGKLEDRTNEFRQKAWEDYHLRSIDLAAIKESLITLRDKMARTIIRSPVKGIVKKIYIVTIGGVINPGVPIMDIVPMDDTLLIQAKVQPKDIAFIHPGQPATVKLTAYDYSIYGGLQGTVEYISADSLEDQKASAIPGSPLPSAYYNVNIRTQRNYLGSDTYKLPIIPGMTATVHIMTGKKSILHYILKPLVKAKDEALRER